MGNNCCKPKSTQTPALQAVALHAPGSTGHGNSAMPITPHVELLSEIESICELYDAFVRSKALHAGAQATRLQLDFEALYAARGQRHHNLVGQLVAPSAAAAQQPVLRPDSPATLSQATIPQASPSQRILQTVEKPNSTQRRYNLPEPLSPRTTAFNLPADQNDAERTNDLASQSIRDRSRPAQPASDSRSSEHQSTTIVERPSHDSQNEYFALQIGVNYSDSDQPIGGVVGNFSSMMQFWAELGVKFSQHVLCSDEMDSARRVGAQVVKDATLEELYSAMQQVSDAMSRSSAKQKFLYLHVVSLTTDAPKPNATGGRGQPEQFGHAIVPCDHEDCGFLFVDEIAAWLGSLPRHSCFAVFDALQSDPVGAALLPIASGTFVSGCHEDVQFATRVNIEAGCQNVTAALLGALNGADDMTESQLKVAIGKAVRSGVPEVSCTSVSVLHGWSLPSAGVASTAHSRFPIAQQPQSSSLGSRTRGTDSTLSLVRSNVQAPVAPSPQSHSGKSSPLFIRRDASVRPALNSGFSLDTRSEQPVSRSSSDARSAFLGTPGTKVLGRRVAATNSSGSRGRKSFLSDDSSPESPLNAARGSVEASTSRFPSAVQLQNISRDATDEKDFSRRNVGMTSPIRRRENAGPGRTLKGGSQDAVAAMSERRPFISSASGRSMAY